MNLKETLKKLHKKFPTMTLDELFDVVDCYVEEIKIYSQSPIISNPYKYYTTTDPFHKDWTVTCDYPKGSVADQISKLNGGITYDNNSTCASGTSNYQLESKH